MKFTNELPKVAGAYWWKNSADHKVTHLVEVKQECNTLLCWCVSGRREPLTNYRGLWSGPLLAPEECVSRHEVEAIYAEGYTDCSAALNESAHAVRTNMQLDWKRSRAFRIASGKEEGV